MNALLKVNFDETAETMPTISGRELHEALEVGTQYTKWYKQGDIWILYQKYAQFGYTSTKTHSVNGKDGQQHSKVHTYWTQKGRLFIYDTLKNDGILPTIEKGKCKKEN